MSGQKRGSLCSSRAEAGLLLCPSRQALFSVGFLATAVAGRQALIPALCGPCSAMLSGGLHHPRLVSPHSSPLLPTCTYSLLLSGHECYGILANLHVTYFIYINMYMYLHIVCNMVLKFLKMFIKLIYARGLKIK